MEGGYDELRGVAWLIGLLAQHTCYCCTVLQGSKNAQVCVRACVCVCVCVCDNLCVHVCMRCGWGQSARFSSTCPFVCLCLCVHSCVMLTCGRVNVKCQGARSLMLLHNFTCHSTIPKQKGVYVCVRLCVDKWLCVEIKADVLLDMGWFYTRVQVKIRYDNKRYIPVTCHTYPAPSCVSCPMPILRCCTRTCVCVCVCV